MLCDKCVNIWTTVRTQVPGAWYGDSPSLFSEAPLKTSWAGAHHIDARSFLAAVSHRCYVCCTIFRDLSADYRAQASLFRTYYRLNPTDQSGECQETGDYYELEFTTEILHGRPPIAKKQVVECTGRFKIFPKSSLSVAVEELQLTNKTLSGKCEAQVQEWLQYCTKNHQQCNRIPPSSGLFPARLLNIAEQGRFRLQTFEPGDQYPSYVTLSHCWDWSAEMPLKLTLNTFKSLQAGLPIQRLTKRFQEAIEIARWMKRDHIWIDALCIEQDSEDDWITQSNLMGDIYANSYCNVAVTSIGQDKGCFTSRIREMVEPYTMPNPRELNGAKTHVIGYDDFWSNSLLDSPLHNRGWVLQERSLAPRTVHFGQEQIFWECRCEMACEAYPKGIPAQFRNHRTKAWRQLDTVLDFEDAALKACEKPSASLWRNLMNLIPVLASPVNQNSGKSFSPSISEVWPKVVERYMGCKLSVSTDKLVAMSGIAQKVAHVTGERYIAGLWDNTRLAQSLLWYVLARRQADGVPSFRAASLGRDGYRAPSWSPFSLEAQIVWKRPTDHERVFVEIQGTFVESFGKSSMGRISSAKMEVKGTLVKAYLNVFDGAMKGVHDEDRIPEETGRYTLCIRDDASNSADPKTHSCIFMRNSISPKELRVEPMVYLDTALILDDMMVYLLPICSEWRSGSGGRTAALAGLLLKSYEGKGCGNTFERIGIFGLSKDQMGILGQSLTSEVNSPEEGLAGAKKTLITLV